MNDSLQYYLNNYFNKALAFIIIGQKSSGKTTLMGQLQSSLQVPGFDLDQEMLKTFAAEHDPLVPVETISDLYHLLQEDQFRALEFRLLQIYGAKKIILSCGGGVVSYLPSLSYLQAAPYILLWDTTIELCLRRVAQKQSGYLGSHDPNFWQQIMHKRSFDYLRAKKWSCDQFEEAHKMADSWKNEKLIAEDSL
jgi:shikimate kinase